MLPRLTGLAVLGACALAALAPGGQATTADTAALLAAYEPVAFSYRADWHPSAIEPFLAGANLERPSGPTWRIVRRSPPASALPHGASTLRLNTRGCSPAVDVDSCYPRRQRPATVYGRVWVSRTATFAAVTVLQYWFFYPLDDWRNSPTRPTLWHMHEGDWEEVSVELGPAGTPIAVASSQHNLGVTRAWARVATIGGTHPRVYVALGSHANYLLPGRHTIPSRFSGIPLSEPDFTSSQTSYGPPGTAAHALPIVDLSNGSAPWLSFAGAWGDGSYVLLADSKGAVFAHAQVGGSPSGPAQHAIWRDPLLPFRSWPADDGH